MTGLRRRLAENLRQRGQHAAFRIAAPDWDDEHLRHLQRALDELTAATRPADPPPAGAADQAPPEPALDEAALAEAATYLWRARHKLALLGDTPKQARQANRFLGTTQDALAGAGLVIQDHDGAAYHPGQSLEVIVMVHDPEVSGETVVETLRPSIYLGDHRIQMGQVVVGCPIEPEHTKEGTRA